MTRTPLTLLAALALTGALTACGGGGGSGADGTDQDATPSSSASSSPAGSPSADGSTGASGEASSSASAVGPYGSLGPAEVPSADTRPGTRVPLGEWAYVTSEEGRTKGRYAVTVDAVAKGPMGDALPTISQPAGAASQRTWEVSGRLVSLGPRSADVELSDLLPLFVPKASDGYLGSVLRQPGYAPCREDRSSYPTDEAVEFCVVMFTQGSGSRLATVGFGGEGSPTDQVTGRPVTWAPGR